MKLTSCLLTYCSRHFNFSSNLLRCHYKNVCYYPPRVKSQPNFVTTAARSFNSFALRSHTCGELRCEHVGQKVTLYGWLQFKRSDRFAIIRDGYGITQLTFELGPEDARSTLLDKTPLESVIYATGTVKKRPSGQESQKMLTGDIEVMIDDFRVLNDSLPNLPFLPRDHLKVTEINRLKYRYIDLRSTFLQQNLRLRSTFVMKVREFLCNLHGFVDVETPTLFRRTPGGAKEFIVPTQFPGLFYSLTQSPQQFKQLLMIGGLDRYFQIARCYRDEGARPDRQPEFTQVDIEMSFITSEGIMSLIEQMLVSCWPTHLPEIRCPFPRMSYQEAMDSYGSDKPDTTFEMKLMDVPDCLRKLSSEPVFKAMIVKDFADKCNKRTQDLFYEYKDTSVNLEIIKFDAEGTSKASYWKKLDDQSKSSVKDFFHLQPNDVLILSSGKNEKALLHLGRVRVLAANTLKQHGVVLSEPEAKNFLWIIDFPLFLKNDEGILESAHHPFTAAHPDDEHLIYSQPEKVRGLHYDLVLNGAEIGGGSIRIHQAELQKYVLRNILKENTEELSHLIAGLESGCPPHGGIALGLDRLVSIICKAPSIRDVIAFPKAADGKDLMANAPAAISDADRSLYHIK